MAPSQGSNKDFKDFKDFRDSKDFKHFGEMLSTESPLKSPSLAHLGGPLQISLRIPQSPLSPLSPCPDGEAQMIDSTVDVEKVLKKDTGFMRYLREISKNDK